MLTFESVNPIRQASPSDHVWLVAGHSAYSESKKLTLNKSIPILLLRNQ